MIQGDVGAPIRATLTVNGAALPLPDGTIVELWIRQPSRRVLRRVASIENATTGAVEYATRAGDLCEHGEYRFQFRALLEDGPLGFEERVALVAPSTWPPSAHVFPEPARLTLRAPMPST